MGIQKQNAQQQKQSQLKHMKLPMTNMSEYLKVFRINSVRYQNVANKIAK